MAKSVGPALGCAKLVPGAQRLGDAPRLGDTASGRERRIAVEDLGDRADTVVFQALRERLAERARGRRVAVDPGVREREGAEEPRPDRALVIGAVARARVAADPGAPAPGPERRTAGSDRGARADTVAFPGRRARRAARARARRVAVDPGGRGGGGREQPRPASALAIAAATRARVAAVV